MWDLDHENIVRYLGTAQSDKYLFIILEYVPGGSIQSMLHQFGAFSESLICRFSNQILSGVDYLHNKGKAVIVGLVGRTHPILVHHTHDVISSS